LDWKKEQTISPGKGYQWTSLGGNWIGKRGKQQAQGRDKAGNEPARGLEWKKGRQQAQGRDNLIGQR